MNVSVFFFKNKTKNYGVMDLFKLFENRLK